MSKTIDSLLVEFEGLANISSSISNLPPADAVARFELYRGEQAYKEYQRIYLEAIESDTIIRTVARQFITTHNHEIDGDIEDAVKSLTEVFYKRNVPFFSSFPKRVNELGYAVNTTFPTLFTFAEWIKPNGSRPELKVHDFLTSFSRLRQIALNLRQGFEQQLYKDTNQRVFDGLTGLFSRDYFEQRLTEHTQSTGYNSNTGQFEKPTGYTFSLMSIDINYLKQFNDNGGGHQAGDLYLRAVANALRKHLRKFDIAARVGGDEISVLLPNCTAEQAYALSNRIYQTVCDDVRQQLGNQYKGFNIGFGVGIAALPEKPPKTVEEALKLLKLNADKAMYLSKLISKHRDRTFPQGFQQTLDQALRQLLDDPSTTVAQAYSPGKEQLYTLAQSVKVPR